MLGRGQVKSSITPLMTGSSLTSVVPIAAILRPWSAIQRLARAIAVGVESRATAALISGTSSSTSAGC